MRASRALGDGGDDGEDMPPFSPNPWGTVGNLRTDCQSVHPGAARTLCECEGRVARASAGSGGFSRRAYVSLNTPPIATIPAAADQRHGFRAGDSKPESGWQHASRPSWFFPPLGDVIGQP